MKSQGRQSGSVGRLATCFNMELQVWVVGSAGPRLACFAQLSSVGAQEAAGKGPKKGRLVLLGKRWARGASAGRPLEQLDYSEKRW